MVVPDFLKSVFPTQPPPGVLEAYLVASGLYYGLWTAAYIFIIKTAIRDKRVGYAPIAAVLNLSWEFLYTFIYAYPQGRWVNFMNFTWFLPDLLIFMLVLKYEGPRLLPIPGRALGPGILFATLALGVGFFVYFRHEYGDITGTEVSFFLNTLGSVLYLTMLFSRARRDGSWDLSGLSRAVTWLKFLGTFIPIWVVTWYFPQWHPVGKFGIMQMLYVAIFCADLGAIFLHQKMIRDNKNRK